MKILKYNEVIITFEPSVFEKNRICGHTFEAFDYYLFLKKNNIPVKILFQEKINPKTIFKAFFDKYEINKSFLKNLDKDFIFNYNFFKIFAPVIINTSGLYKQEQRDKYLTKIYIQFLCNYDVSLSFFKKNDYILADKRIYQNYEILNTIPTNVSFYHYIKKFSFDFYKEINVVENKVLIYLNSQFRKINEEKLFEYQERFKKILFVTGSDFDPKLMQKFNILQAPVRNLFTKFDTYLYTPTTRRFDCSPRLLTESYFYNKMILFDFDFNQYAGPNYGDTGLFWRWYDINNNFENLYLKEDDLILEIINTKGI